MFADLETRFTPQIRFRVALADCPLLPLPPLDQTPSPVILRPLPESSHSLTSTDQHSATYKHSSLSLSFEDLMMYRLPRGMETLDLIRDQNLAYQKYLIVFTSLMIWDWLSLLRTEYRHIYRAKHSFLKVCYLLNRYGTIALVLIYTTLALTPISPEVCRRIFWIETLALIYVVLITDIMLMHRVFAVFERSRKVLIGLTILFALETAAMIAAGTQVGPIEMSRKVANYVNKRGCYAGNYRGSGFEEVVLFLSAVPLTVNGILLLSTFYRSWSLKREFGDSLPLLQRMSRDGLQYFLVITAYNALNFYFYKQPNHCIKAFNIAANCVCSSLLSCRLALSLFDAQPSTPNYKLRTITPLPSAQPTPMISNSLASSLKPLPDAFQRGTRASLKRNSFTFSKRNSAGLGSRPRATLGLSEDDVVSISSSDSYRTVELM